MIPVDAAIQSVFVTSMEPDTERIPIDIFLSAVFKI